MNQPLSGAGLGLPLPQNLYPSELNNAPYDYATNQVTLAPGQNLVIPAGDYFISCGGYLVLQYKDPITGAWVLCSGAAFQRGPLHVTSDGQNIRVANLTGCAVAAVITSRGASYVQGSTSISVTSGAPSQPTFAPIIGGALAVATSVANSGAGYGIAPLVLIPAPPPYTSNPNGVGGVQASGYVGIASGTVVAAGLTLTNQGAGYPAAPANFALLPVPTDPNLALGITLGTIGFSLTSASMLMGVICTNNGGPFASPTAVTLTVNGAGVTATVSCVVMQTITAATVSGAGIGYGTGATAVFAAGGGISPAGIGLTPFNIGLGWFPRLADITLTPGNTSVSVGSAAVIVDGGLFLSAPAAAWPAQVGAATTVGTVAFTMGSTPDIAYIQPAP